MKINKKLLLVLGIASFISSANASNWFESKKEQVKSAEENLTNETGEARKEINQAEKNLEQAKNQAKNEGLESNLAYGQ